MVTMVSEVERDDMTEKKGKNVRAGETWLAVRIPEDAKERLEEIAKREERSMSYVVRRYVLEGLGRDEEQQHPV